jgi:hypothetical protein
VSFDHVYVTVFRSSPGEPWRIESASFEPDLERFHAGDAETKLLVCSVIDERDIEPREERADEVGADLNVPSSLCREVVERDGRKRLCDLPFDHEGEHDPFPEAEEKPAKGKKKRVVL